MKDVASGVVNYLIKTLELFWTCLTSFAFIILRAGLHQASASALDARDTPLIQIDGVAPKRVATPFWSDCICFHSFQ